MSKRKVAYYYHESCGDYYYGVSHPMKPHRIRMTHNLLLNYGLFKQLYVYRPPLTSAEDMTKFHTDDYVNFLKTITPDNAEAYAKQLVRFNVGEDCPVFDGIFEFSQLSAGGSIGGAVRLNKNEADIVINWAGGLHHAKKSEASGFCYINDIVLGILELLKVHDRVLYIDIDIHHGDGVEEAFYTTDRVMTCSFHKFGEFFPGTGDPTDIGYGPGRNYAVNFPLKDGITDNAYESIFKPVIGKIMENYRPGAIVLQCGADSLAGDRLGAFNLSVKGHAKCVEFVKSFNVPTLVLGGGGYTIRNVARAWTYETSVLLDTEISDRLPYNDYIDYYGPDYRLHTEPSNMANQNTPEYLHKHLEDLLENLRQVQPISVDRYERPPDSNVNNVVHEDKLDPDQRLHQSELDNHVEHPEALVEDNEGKRNKENGGDAPAVTLAVGAASAANATTAPPAAAAAPAAGDAMETD
eukprot:TRINITY_DN5291_c0_g1_i1.p1 TRINITY_DN5291_c0_g1~~TRINITY_DN5291_c0_g1_i1.p1  ORF type:complete len:476 (+),score=103.69 TRINITY_DN5291_c0_g1_i1:32-1429(+)